VWKATYTNRWDEESLNHPSCEMNSIPNSPEIESLRKKLEELQRHNPYPCSPRADRPKMLPIERYVQELAFFPVGPGCRETVFPRNKIMVLGNNFGSQGYIEKVCAERRGDTRGPTWRNMCELFRHAHINEECCFFTNAYMGAIPGNKNMGKTPGCDDPDYLKFCQQMFFYQLEQQSPRLIVALGKWVPPFLAKFDLQHLQHWESEDFKKRDKELEGRGAVVRSACLRRVNEAGRPIEHECVVASILHPCRRKLNLGLRSYRGLERHEAEMKILKDALCFSGLQGACA
jgi:hypothetical protein